MTPHIPNFLHTWHWRKGSTHYWGCRIVIRSDCRADDQGAKSGTELGPHHFVKEYDAWCSASGRGEDVAHIGLALPQPAVQQLRTAHREEVGATLRSGRPGQQGLAAPYTNRGAIFCKWCIPTLVIIPWFAIVSKIYKAFTSHSIFRGGNHKSIGVFVCVCVEEEQRKGGGDDLGAHTAEHRGPAASQIWQAAPVVSAAAR